MDILLGKLRQVEALENRAMEMEEACQRTRAKADRVCADLLAQAALLEASKRRLRSAPDSLGAEQLLRHHEQRHQDALSNDEKAWCRVAVAERKRQRCKGDLRLAHVDLMEAATMCARKESN